VEYALRKEREEKDAREREAEKQKGNAITEKDYYRDSDLSHRQKEDLYSRGYRKLKISAFGNSGSAYYWVKKKSREGIEHSFFCYLIRDLIKAYGAEVEMNDIRGPDLAFQVDGRWHCIDIETGSNIVRNPAYLERRYAEYGKLFGKCYIFVTSKKLKRAYGRYATVATRTTIRGIVESIFR